MLQELRRSASGNKAITPPSDIPYADKERSEDCRFSLAVAVKGEQLMKPSILRVDGAVDLANNL